MFTDRLLSKPFPLLYVAKCPLRGPPTCTTTAHRRYRARSSAGGLVAFSTDSPPRRRPSLIRDDSSGCTQSPTVHGRYTAACTLYTTALYNSYGRPYLRFGRGGVGRHGQRLREGHVVGSLGRSPAAPLHPRHLQHQARRQLGARDDQ